MLEIYGQYFPQDPPALTVVQQSPTGPNNRPLVQFSAIAVRSITAGRKENGTSSETERR